MKRGVAVTGSALCFGALALFAASAPQYLPDIDAARAYLGPADAPPFGTDQRGRALLAYAQQGASVILLPAIAAGLAVGAMSVVGGLLRCVGSARVDTTVQAFGEIVGSLPRMVVILVAALLIPPSWRGLLPLALIWALLASPGAMDEAASVAERLGGARFVEALRAHGFSWSRIFLYHVVLLNLRPVVVRQAAETAMQVTFLELALSYLSTSEKQSSFTHADSVHSWAELLYIGYPSLVLDVPTGHALALGLGLVALVTAMALLLSGAARAR
jgi:ABC-type dipeptide/oligopeptide/nickel transport system permease subunit